MTNPTGNPGMLPDLIQKFAPLLTLLAMPLLLWPSLLVVIGLAAQAKGNYVLKPKHIAIFVAIQLIWLIIVFLFFTQFSVVKSLNLEKAI